MSTILSYSVADVHKNNKLTGQYVRKCSSNDYLADDMVMRLRN
jgi:hypothetical protein